MKDHSKPYITAMFMTDKENTTQHKQKNSVYKQVVKYKEWTTPIYQNWHGTRA